MIKKFINIMCFIVITPRPYEEQSYAIEIKRKREILYFPDPSDDDIDEGMTNLCRCGTYQRIRSAIKRAAATIQ